MLEDKLTLAAFLMLVFVVFLGLFGGRLAPYDPEKILMTADGGIARFQPPSLSHPLGTNGTGQDILSRILVGAKPTIITGLLGGTLIISIGLTVGLTSGYLGGRTDDILMRFTDLLYALPVIPFAIVIVGYFGIGFYTTILLIGSILWRGSARVIRSQVLQIKERPFVLAAKSTGASDLWIVRKHILPNVATMAILYLSLGIGVSILVQAALAFLGLSDPFVPSWGVILRNAYGSGQMASAWWWTLSPGLLISATVASAFLFGRGYERVAGQTSNVSGDIGGG